MQNKLISIGTTAKLLGVSIDTLRRWDFSGRLQSNRSGARGHRFYRQADISEFLQDIESKAKHWMEAPQAVEPESDVYCQTRDVFQARLEQFQAKLSRLVSISTVSLVTAVAGEIGNNSFDHNLGNWPDVLGIYFAYSLRNRNVVLADRGQGILKTLKRARPDLTNAQTALKVAFTETISGRYPEARGNGLKFVRSIIVSQPLTLFFQSGNSSLKLKQNSKYVIVRRTEKSIRGCFATIGFDKAL